NKCFKIFDGYGNGIASLLYHFDFMNLDFSNNHLTATLNPAFKNIISMSFPSGKTGYALQAPFTNPWASVYKTTDGGLSFQKLPVDSFYANNLFFVTEHLGFACGRDGKIYKTTNGGATGIAEVNPAKIKLFPNPAYKTIFLEYENILPKEVALFDISGKRLKVFPPSSRSEERRVGNGGRTSCS